MLELRNRRERPDSRYISGVELTRFYERESLRLFRDFLLESPRGILVHCPTEGV